MKDQKSNKLPRGFTLAWGSRGVSLAINVILLMQITYYATEVVGLTASVVGGIILASKLFDGVTDIIVGYVIDKTKTRWGKARPYEFFIIPLWAFTVVLFSTPVDMSTTGKIVYIFAFYSLINAVCSTVLNGSDGTYLSRALKDPVNQGQVLARSGVLVMMVGAVGGMILPQLMATWGTQPGGWTKISLVYAVPFTIFGLMRFIFIKEREDMENVGTNKLTIKENMKLVSKNKYIFILGLLILLCNILINISSVVQTYYFTYIVGNLGLLTVVMMVGMLAPFILLLFPLAMRTIGGFNFVKIGLIIAAIGSVIKFFAGASLPMLVVGGLLSGVGSSFLTMMQGLFVIQCMDYGEWKTGIRVEAFLNSVTSFASKIGMGLASVIVGLLMGMAGYVGGAEVQTASALTSIVWIYSLIPAIICVIMLFIMRFYDLDKRQPEIQAELEIQRNTQNN